MRSYILIPALAALNLGAVSVTAASTKSPNFDPRSLAAPNPSAEHAHLFKHEIIPRQYRAEDWTSSPHDHGKFAPSHGAGKRSLRQGDAGDRIEGKDWLESRGLGSARGRRGACIRGKGTRGGSGTQRSCTRRGQLGEGNKGGRGEGGPGPIKVQREETWGAKEGKDRGRSGSRSGHGSQALGEGARGVCSKTNKAGGRDGSGRPDEAQEWGACGNGAN